MKKRHSHALLGLLFGLYVATPSQAATFEGVVTRVSDGDTLVLRANGQDIKVRLANIDAPEVAHGAKERSQPFGHSSKVSLEQMTLRQNAVASCHSKSYDRQVCFIRVGTLDVNAEQVRRGMAWVERRYNRDVHLVQLEDLARKNRVGLWQDANPIQPSQWRHQGMARQ
jgi:endonuclease YncB( thermonuclease family)